MSEGFATATAVELIDVDGATSRYRAAIHDGWDIGGNANGGYVLAVVGRAMAAAMDRPPLTVTGHYLAPEDRPAMPPRRGCPQQFGRYRILRKARRRRHGRRLPGPRHAARPPGRPQGAAPSARRTRRSNWSASSARPDGGRGLRTTPTSARSTTSAQIDGIPLPDHGLHRGRAAAPTSSSPTSRCASQQAVAPSSARSPWPWRRPTSAASSTAT